MALRLPSRYFRTSSVWRRPRTRAWLLLAAVDRPRDWGEDTSGDLKGERHEAEAYLRSLQARHASATGNDVECEVVSSEPAAAILDAAERQHSDLIAMTTH